MDKKNSKIKKISAVDQVCESLKENIDSGMWKSGERIPSEGELSQIFGVNRLTVRLALQKLVTLGLIETKVGDGSYVKDFSFLEYFKEVAPFLSGSDQFEDIFAARKLIEIECARLAIEKGTDEDKVALKKCLDVYLDLKAEYQKNGPEQYLSPLVEADLKFHEQICNMSHNFVYREVFSLIRELISRYLEKNIQTKNTLWLLKKYTENIDTHVVIYETIIAGDFAACQKAYIETIFIPNP